MSESPEHSVRLDYAEGSASITLLWEPMPDNCVLETKFSSTGAILDQKLVRLSSSTLKEMVDTFMEQHSLEPRETVFEEPRLEAACPSCGSHDIVRYIKAAKGSKSVPVMPMYACRNCGAKSYYLTDEYLKKLVRQNPGLFEGKDLGELDKNEERFIKELREYIARVFASKKILSARP